MPFVHRFLIPILWTTTLFAQAAYFGPRAPLTNTRYGALSGKPALASNGAQTFVFVSTDHSVRMARIGDAVARPVLDASDADATWTGSEFLVVGTARGAIVGRFVRANGDAAGEPFTIVERGTRPRVAVDGERMLLLYENAGVQSLMLTREGAPSGTPQAVASSASAYDVAVSRGEFIAALATAEGVKLLALGASAGVTHVSDAIATDVSVAANSEQVSVAWTHAGGVDAAVVANGVAEAAFNVAADAVHAALTWTGSSFETVLARANGLHVARLNPGARTAPATELAFTGAPDQALVATTSVATATLLVWNEGNDAHVGLRFANGAWRERRLAYAQRAFAAASDGNAFVVLTGDDHGWSASWLDANGAVVQQSPRVTTLAARAVAANANGAIAIGRDASGNIAAARLSRDGSVSDAVVLRAGADDPVVATDGTNFIAAWETPEKTIESVRLDAALQRLDAADLIVFFAEAEDPAVAFNGTDYVFVARVGEFVRGRRVTVAGEKIFEIIQTGRAGGEPPRALALTQLDGAVGLTWHDGRSQLLLLDFGATPWTVRTATGFDSRPDAAPRFAALPNGGVAFVHGEVTNGAPHHGSARLAMSIAHPSAPTAPDAPRATVAQEGGRLRVSWTAPSQPVNGYRVEYRIDDGPWLESEGWMDAGTHSAAADARKGGLYTVRVRAWGDGGTSTYSEAVSVQFTPTARRRAVR